MSILKLIGTSYSVRSLTVYLYSCAFMAIEFIGVSEFRSSMELPLFISRV